MCCTFMVDSTSMLASNRLHYIFVTFRVLTAFDIGMCQFVDQHDSGPTGEDRIHIHFIERCSLVFHPAPRYCFQL